MQPSLDCQTIRETDANIFGGLVNANISGSLMDANIFGALVDANISGSLSAAIARLPDNTGDGCPVERGRQASTRLG